MSLACAETRERIKFGEPLMAGTRSDAQFFSALCKEVLDQIPKSKRRAKPCKPKVGGVDIHKATSTLNTGGSYTWCGFTLGEFCYSISQKAAEHYLPKHIKEYDSPAECQ